MKTNYTPALIFSVLAIIFTSCLPDSLEVKSIESAPAQIVVTSSVLPDTSIAILVTRSIGALEAGSDTDIQTLVKEIAINDANVTITTQGQTYELILMQDGVYQSLGIPIVPGNEYSLEVSCPAYGKVTAKTIVQPRVNFDTVKADVWNNGYNTYLAQVAYSITDPTSENYYMINVQGAARASLIANMVNPDAYTRFFDDKPFNGDNYSEIFRAAPKNYYRGDSIAVSISTLTRDYYDYLKVRVQNRMGLVEVFSEPVTYPTNVNGGRGFFTLHLPDVKVMVL
ncbi:MAG TPA: DUF4249 domain-containing protein [Chryseosolibacter sp.]|nr:DUF4249 domain-containing protein [Chryseosolibacter sp.]